MENTVVITAKTWFTENQIKNFYLTNAFQWFTWMLFHFAVVYFFTSLLDSIALVGIFLWLANFIAFLLDVPLWILQRYISTKKFFIIWIISQLIAIGIFFTLISQAFGLQILAAKTLSAAWSQQIGEFVSDKILGSWLTWIWLLVASLCYGFTKELNDVSTFGYILSNSNPSEYGTILSRSNITFGIWSVLGLGLSGLILSLNNVFALIILWLIILWLLIFTAKFFDNTAETITMSDIKEFVISVKKINTNNIKENLSQTIKNTDLQKVITNAKYIFYKPQQKSENQKIPWKQVFSQTKRELIVIWEIISHSPLHYGLIWWLILVLAFGFWDTFASSFLIDYLDKVKQWWWYILLAIIWIPGIVLQEVAIKLWQKIWDKKIGMVWLFLSWISLIVMWILALTDNPWALAIIVVSLVNSLWYACGMAIWQNTFLDMYNKIYAEHEKLKEIDANASAGPMKVIQNLANVVWLTLGWLLLAFGFSTFFFVFAIIIIIMLIWTIKNSKDIKL